MIACPWSRHNKWRVYIPIAIAVFMVGLVLSLVIQLTKPAEWSIDEVHQQLRLAMAERGEYTVIPVQPQGDHLGLFLIEIGNISKDTVMWIPEGENHQVSEEVTYALVEFPSMNQLAQITIVAAEPGDIITLEPVDEGGEFRISLHRVGIDGSTVYPSI